MTDPTEPALAVRAPAGQAGPPAGQADQAGQAEPPPGPPPAAGRPPGPAATCRSRSAVGVILGALAIVTLFTVKATFLLLVALAVGVALWEVSRAFASRNLIIPSSRSPLPG